MRERVQTQGRMVMVVVWGGVQGLDPGGLCHAKELGFKSGEVARRENQRME